MTAHDSSRILVVDDDPDLRDLLADYLGVNGFQVTAAANGQAMHQRSAATGSMRWCST